MNQELYKRNQVDAALHAVLSGPFHTALDRIGQSVPTDFRTRITRLLEIDRKWGHKNKRRLAEFPMAFHDELPEGTGFDVKHSAFNAFMLAIALGMVRFGFKQGEVAEAAGLLRKELEPNFHRSTQYLQTAGRLRVTNVPISSERKDELRSGSADEERRIYLILRQVEISHSLSKTTKGILKAGKNIIDSKVLQGWQELQDFLRQEIPKTAHIILLLELSELAARVVELLPLQPALKRGRS